MKALSIKQPFAELILQGRKKIDLRKWNTKFRGEFLIHSPKVPDWDGMIRFGFFDLPCGFILGKVRLTGVKRYIDEEEHFIDRNLHLASSELGNYGFVLENPERIDKILAKGSLNFWNFENKY